MDRIPIVSLVHYTKKELREALGEKAVEFLNWEDFCWIKRKNDTPIKHPEWPDNFIKAVRCLVYEVEGLEQYKDLKYIFLNAGGEILKKIVQDKIPVIIVMPKKFEGKYTPVEHYQDLNRRYLELDMPMIYLDDSDFINAFSRESTYKYLRDKTEFVEGFRFGTCDFIEDLDEMDAAYQYYAEKEKAQTCKDIADEAAPVGPFAVVSHDGLTIDTIDGFMSVLEYASTIANTSSTEYTIKDKDGITVCKVGINESGETMIRKADF